MDNHNNRFPEQRESNKIHGNDDPVPKMKPDVDPAQDGHVKEWQDRARVVLDAKESAMNEGSDKQSPGSEDIEDVEEKSKDLQRGNDNY